MVTATVDEYAHLVLINKSMRFVNFVHGYMQHRDTHMVLVLVEGPSHSL